MHRPNQPGDGCAQLLFRFGERGFGLLELACCNELLDAAHCGSNRLPSLVFFLLAPQRRLDITEKSLDLWISGPERKRSLKLLLRPLKSFFCYELAGAGEECLDLATPGFRFTPLSLRTLAIGQGRVEL